MPGAFGTADEATLRAAAAAEPGTDGIDLVAERHDAASPTRVTAHRQRHTADRRLRLRHQAHDPAVTSSALGTVEVVPASTTGGRGVGTQARRRVPVERPGRPGDGRVRGRHDRRAARRGAGVRHLPRPSTAQPGDRRRHVQAAVRSSRWQPPGAPRADRSRRDHQPEPQLLRRPGEPRRQGRR